MRNRSALFCLSLVTAVLCGAWSAAAAWTGLIGWAGFAGCTTYFSSGEHGIRGIKKSLIPNLTGILCGMCILGFGHMIPLFQSTGIWCAVLTFVMCIIARFRLFSFCPGTFMGCFSTFAADGNWLLLVPSIAVGVCLGAACEYGGTRLFQAVARAKEQ